MPKPPLPPRLQEILGRLVEPQAPPFLTEEERAHVESLLPGPAPQAGEARPLWWWIRENYARHGASPLGGLSVEFGDDAGDLLRQAGALPAANNAVGYLTTFITREALEAALRSRLLPGVQSGQVNRATMALVGLAGLEGLQGLLVGRLSKGLRGEDELDDETLLGGVQSAAMLGAPGLGELLRLSLGRDQEALTQAALHGCLSRPGLAGDDVLLEALAKRPLLRELLGYHTEEYLRLNGAGFPLLAQLASSLEGGLPLLFALGAARVVVALKSAALLEVMLGSDDRDARGAAAAEALRGRATWARDAVQRRLQAEEDEQIFALLTAAVGGLGEPRSWFDQMARSSDWRQAFGAALASLRRDDAAEIAAEVLAEPNPHSGLPQLTSAALLAASVGAGRPSRALVAQHLRQLLQTASLWAALLAADLCAERAPGVAPSRERILLLQGLDFAGDYGEMGRLIAEEPLLFRSPENERFRIAAAVADPARFASALEDAFLGANTFGGYTALADLACVGGPEGAVCRAKASVLLDDGRPQPAAALVMLANASEPDIAGRAFARLPPPEAEMVLSYDLSGDNHALLEESLGYIDRNRELNEPIPRAIGRLLDGKLGSLDEVPAKLFWLRHGPVMQSIAELAVSSASPERAFSLLIEILPETSDSDAQRSLIRSLASLDTERAQIEGALLQLSHQGDWVVRQEAARHLGERGSEAAIPRLLEMILDGDQDVAEAAVRACAGLLKRHPRPGLFFLPVSSSRLLGAYLDESIDDDSPEAQLGVLTRRYDEKKSADEARQHRGRRMIVSKVRPREAVAPSGSPVDLALFEGLLIFLRVIFADNEAGAVVVEVTDQPTGELLGALLEDRNNLTCKIDWS